MHLDEKQIDAFLRQKIQEKKLSGVAVAVRGPEGFAFERGYGWRDAARTIAPDGETIFGIASMGKSMAALCCAILAAEGKMSLDDPVAKYVPAFRVPGNPVESVTVRHLAMHTTGIPPMEPLEWSIACNTPGRETEWSRKMKETAPNAMDRIEQIIEYIGNCPYPTLGGSGEYMSYSNEGYAVLCYVVDAAAGQSLETFLDERVFGPVGMTRTTLDADGSRARVIASDGNITALFEQEGGTLTADEQWSVLPPFRACACVKSTARDMARYYQCLSNRGKIDGKQALPEAAVELMAGAGFPEQEKAYYCLGLNKRRENGHVYCEHSGGLHGVSSQGAFLQGEDYGFAVLCNQGDCDVTELMWALYNWVLGQPLEQTHYWLHAAEGAFSEPEMLTGRYVSHEGVPEILTVFMDEGKLAMEKDGTRYTPVFCGETWFQLLNAEGKVFNCVRFLVRNGQAWGAQVYTRIFQRMDR